MFTAIVSSKEKSDVKLCVTVSVSSANVTLWYTYDNRIHESLPSKIESDAISNMIIDSKNKLEEFKERQSVLGESEQDLLRRNNDADEEIILATVIEAGVIVLLAVIETLVLKRFISKKEFF